jgi:hypothetical protein
MVTCGALTTRVILEALQANPCDLCLGAGESGKSTVLKQMKLIYAQGFSKNEKLEWKPVVFNNIVQAFRMIYDAMNELELKFENEENEASIHLLSPCAWVLCRQQWRQS